MRLDSPVTDLRGVGPKRSELLVEAGFATIRDLLFHLPFRYEDRRFELLISDLTAPGRFMFRGRLVDLRCVRLRGRGRTLVLGSLEQAGRRLAVRWFNRPYLINQVSPGADYALFGEIRRRGEHWELVNPSIEPAGTDNASGRIVPVYTAVAGLGAPTIRRLLRQILESSAMEEIEDPIPQELRTERGLPSLGEALRSLHAPRSDADVERLNERQTGAHARLSYGEFLAHQVGLALVRREQVQAAKEHRYAIDTRLRRLFHRLLPFQLTGAQSRVLDEILADMNGAQPMLRMLQGDVGSGKTVVAALGLVASVESGLQGAMMAPTELLAEQHMASLTDLLGARYKVACLTGSSLERQRTIDAVQEGRVDVLVGTHALIEERIAFNKLGLVVIDEQHRFGVGQRRRLIAKGDCPDVLVMTATPIPRSLAMTLYGDLALSVIDEMPPGRRAITTRIVEGARRRQVYTWVRKKVEEGAQVYVVFPLIGDSGTVNAESLESRGEQLREYLGSQITEILHGRMGKDEREEAMRRFRQGEIRVLVATTVIEVGVDVPNASVMVIENGERFGLAQLHQLRGRIGRGSAASHCVILHGRLTDSAKRRLEVLARESDGFAVAEADLAIRGPGDLLGDRQSGIPLFRVASLVHDMQWLEAARADARSLIQEPGRFRAASFIAGIRDRVGFASDAWIGG